ncbi:MAG: acyltransferase, partial [Firmicutes bacterium]|nr:acyltransferase [Bacillota bacterium]
SYGLYVFHYLPLSACAYLLTKYAALPPLPVYILVLLSGLFGGLLLEELICRIPFLRFAVLGIKKKK